MSAMASIETEILVGRQDDGISKRFRHANEASISQTHRNVGILLDQPHNGLDVFGKFEANQQSTAANQCAEIGCATPSKKVEGLG